MSNDRRVRVRNVSVLNIDMRNVEEAFKSRQLQPKSIGGYVSKLRKMAEVINVNKEAFAVDPFVRNADGTIENAVIRVNGKIKFPRMQVPITFENGKALFLLLSFDNALTRDDSANGE